MKMITVFIPNVKTCCNPLALRARSLRNVVEYRMFTVIHCMKRASEASGFSTADTIENLSTSVAIVSVCNERLHPVLILAIL